MRRMAFLALAAMLATQAGCAGVAKRAARSATEGAMGAVAGKVGDREGLKQLGAGLKRRVAGGLMDELGQPERLGDLERISAALAAGTVAGASRAAGAGAKETESVTVVEALAEQAAGAFSRQMVSELGTAGEGPLARSLSATSERMSDSMMRGARGELTALFPECRGIDGSTCLERAAERVGRASSAGAMAGIREALGVWPYVIVFGAGGIFVLVLGWGWGVYRARRRVPR